MPDQRRVADQTMGRHIRSLRRARDLTLQRIADDTSLSRGFLSQIESGQATPSLASLTRIAAALGVPVEHLLGVGQPAAAETPAPEAPAAPRRPAPGAVGIVRHNRRKQIVWPGWSVRSSLLSPDFQRQLQGLLDELDPGSVHELEPGAADGEVFGWLVEGRCEVTVGDQTYVLDPGDSLSCPAGLALRVVVLGDDPVRLLWVRTPPSL